jgi:hypothetical protein
MHLIRSKVFISAAVVVAVLGIAGALVLASNNYRASKVESISPEIAVTYALAYAQAMNQVGGATDLPTEARRAVMSYDEALKLVYGKKAPQSNSSTESGNRMVWLVALQGDFVVALPSAPGVPASESKHSQMGVIFDSMTGEILERVFISPEKELDVTSLPSLKIDPQWNLSTPLASPLVSPLRITEAPFPTLGPPPVTISPPPE